MHVLTEQVYPRFSVSNLPLRERARERVRGGRARGERVRGEREYGERE
jgi:hypothetical protein